MADSFPEKKLKIGIYFSQPPGSGGGNTAEYSYLEQIQKALDNKHEIVILKDFFPIDLNIFKSNLEVIDVHQNVFEKTIQMIFTSTFFLLLFSTLKVVKLSNFEKILKRNKINFVISLGMNSLVNELQQIPYMTFIWDVGHVDLNSFLEISGNNKIIIRENLLKIHLLKSRFVLVESEIGKKNLEFYYNKNPNHIFVAPFVVTKRDLEISDRFDLRDFILYPAAFWPHKNHEVLIYALHILKLSGKRSRHLVLTGADKGNKNHILDLVRKYNLEHSVNFKDYVDDSTLNELYSKADAVVMPSLLGPTNYPPLEALCFGTPVFASQTDGFDVRLKKYMEYIEPYDAKEWSKVFDLENTHLKKDVKKIVKILYSIEKNNIEIFKKCFEIASKEILLNSGYLDESRKRPSFFIL